MDRIEDWRHTLEHQLDLNSPTMQRQLAIAERCRREVLQQQAQQQLHAEASTIASGAVTTNTAALAAATSHDSPAADAAAIAPSCTALAVDVSNASAAVTGNVIPSVPAASELEMAAADAAAPAAAPKSVSTSAAVPARHAHTCAAAIDLAAACTTPSAPVAVATNGGITGDKQDAAIHAEASTGNQQAAAFQSADLNATARADTHMSAATHSSQLNTLDAARRFSDLHPSPHSQPEHQSNHDSDAVNSNDQQPAAVRCLFTDISADAKTASQTLTDGHPMEQQTHLLPQSKSGGNTALPLPMPALERRNHLPRAADDKTRLPSTKSDRFDHAPEATATAAVADTLGVTLQPQLQTLLSQQWDPNGPGVLNQVQQSPVADTDLTHRTFHRFTSAEAKLRACQTQAARGAALAVGRFETSILRALADPSAGSRSSQIAVSTACDDVIAHVADSI